VLAIMARLRDPKDGCPWDVEQSFAAIATAHSRTQRAGFVPSPDPPRGDRAVSPLEQ